MPQKRKFFDILTLGKFLRYFNPMKKILDILTPGKRQCRNFTVTPGKKNILGHFDPRKKTPKTSSTF